MKGHMIKQ